MILAAERYVFEDGLIEEYTLLLDQSDVVTQPVGVQSGYRISVNGDFARSWRVELHEQVPKRTLPGSTLADHEGSFTSREEECCVVEDVLVGSYGIGKRHLWLVNDFAHIR